MHTPPDFKHSKQIAVHAAFAVGLRAKRGYIDFIPREWLDK